ncbi:MAG: hypothetical protein DHS20C01_35180 [marine bacterium B5-7]|nr:MAG: hypothetical protein DHS20C01_35180 [marine bacterium B5-7]
MTLAVMTTVKTFSFPTLYIPQYLQIKAKWWQEKSFPGIGIDIDSVLRIGSFWIHILTPRDRWSTLFRYKGLLLRSMVMHR